MKRKLDANDVPSTDAAEGDNESQNTFESLTLDPRLRQALVKENFSKPTLVQSKAIPLALEGKDILGTFPCRQLGFCQLLLILI
jgi:ATP-dependent RNA helicase DDX56/DBP9